jgi:hypothetical protein
MVRFVMIKIQTGVAESDTSNCEISFRFKVKSSGKELREDGEAEKKMSFP